jgi:hypothetical protein
MGASLSTFISKENLTVTNLVCGSRDYEYLKSTVYNTHLIKLSRNKYIRNIQRLLYFLKNHRKYSSIIFVGSYNPIFFIRKGIVLVHDFYAYDLPNSYSTAQYLYYKYMVYNTIRFAEGAITTTNANKIRLSNMVPSLQHIFVFDFVEHSLDKNKDKERNKVTQILMVFTKVPNKRWEVLLSEANRLNQEYPNKYGFTLITNDSDYFQKYVADLYPNLKARFLSSISKNAMMLEYKNADLLWSASKVEGYGIPVHTAAQAGAIVILPKTDINIESSGSTGLYYSIDNKCDPLARITSNFDKKLLSKEARNLRKHKIVEISEKKNNKFYKRISKFIRY